MSTALEAWQGSSQKVFDEVEHAHRAVGGDEPGRRYLTRQINYAYTALLAAHFQAYCRAVHTETAQLLAANVPDSGLARVLEGSLTEKRTLDRGNATSAALRDDFDRFGFVFWDEMKRLGVRNKRRQEKLNHLNEWRNAIVHGDVKRKQQEGKLVPKEVHFGTCRDWRKSLGELAIAIDTVLARRCENLGGPKPW